MSILKNIVENLNEGYKIIDTQNKTMKYVDYQGYEVDIIRVDRNGAVVLMPNGEEEYIKIDDLMYQDSRIKDIK